MDDKKMDAVLKNYFNVKINLPEETLHCPAPEIIAQYASGWLSGDDSGRVESHVKNCRLCSELLEDAFLYSAYNKDIKLEEAPRRIKNKAKSLNPASAGKKDGAISYLKKKIWLILSILSVSASFFIPRYFLQFIALMIIFGLKWVFDKETSRTLIMVYNAWRKHDKAGERDLEEIFKDRL